jgi:hypothetical protein
MANSIYGVNKGINKSVEFKGLKAQYIWWLGGGVVAILILFVVLYVAGLNSYVCIAIALGLGTGAVTYIFNVSHKYGEFGLMKMRAKRNVPKYIKCKSRKIFMR